MHLVTLLLIAVGLSMDAFSLSLAYGTQDISKSHIIILSIIVGIYHFFMPLIGKSIGTLILSIIKINPNIIVFVVLVLIGIEMFIESFKDHKQNKIYNILELLIFGFAVSIDSFSVGVGFTSITNKYITGSIIFSVTSFIFTYLGLILGNKISSIIGSLSTKVGSIILIIIGITYLFK